MWEAIALNRRHLDFTVKLRLFIAEVVNMSGMKYAAGALTSLLDGEEGEEGEREGEGEGKREGGTEGGEDECKERLM
jgi:hypothetical protein